MESEKRAGVWSGARRFLALGGQCTERTDACARGIPIGSIRRRDSQENDVQSRVVRAMLQVDEPIVGVGYSAPEL